MYPIGYIYMQKKIHILNKKKAIISKSEMIAVQNAITGEMESAKVTIHVQRDIIRYKDAFTILFQSATLSIVREIKPITAKLLMYLNATSQYSNIIDRTVQQIAEELNYKRNQVNKGLKQLVELNIIIKSQHPTDHRKHILMLNPHQSWKGKPVERSKAIAKLADKAQLQLQLPE